MPFAPPAPATPHPVLALLGRFDRVLGCVLRILAARFPNSVLGQLFRAHQQLVALLTDLATGRLPPESPVRPGPAAIPESSATAAPSATTDRLMMRRQHSRIHKEAERQRGVLPSASLPVCENSLLAAHVGRDMHANCDSPAGPVFPRHMTAQPDSGPQPIFAQACPRSTCA